MSRPESPSSPGPSTTSPSKSGSKSQRGVSIFPTARVARIIKADRDVDICSKEATFLISMATEIFVRKLTDEAYTNAKLDKRKHIFYKDLSRAVQQNEFLEFLKDAIPTPMALSSALEARQDKLQQKQTEENMILEGTLQDEDEEEEEEDEEEEEEEGGDEGEEEGNAADEGAADEEAQDEPADDEDSEQQQPQQPAKASKKASPKKSKSKSQPAAEAQQDADEQMDQDDD
ncbi:related to DPB3-third-largest subunit of DNA polymerase II [Sporisorium reilianum f. sp. reilianum]|uniref:Related to DPB3-third-largest subunit of DNA polymerase II n=1 Tax=Sporisorium reilianum f. sp. reilianum TaxID=72559 RepID=A0A2N8UB79_9BASI|nr:related to DPB3-third-largest subunit of DNA polymerase II [Sporisorium reilianum f. sp. reilianum]